jgi:predicted AlkP superfamily phosphohydrolase/phosphomutase
MASGERTPRLFVFGWDGADWAVIEKGWESGRIATLRSIVERGQRGTLMTTFPPLTPSAWTSFMTGKGPGEHGIYGFVAVKPGSYRAVYQPGGARRIPTLLQRLDRKGYRTIQVTVPWTYPAEKVEHGAVVPGWDDPSETFDSTHPPEIAAELAARVAKVPRRILHQFASVKRVMEEHDESLALTEQIFRHLMDRVDPDVSVLVWPETDKGAHRVWSRGPIPDDVIQIYDQVDRLMGRLIADYVREDDTVLIVSDHGTVPIHTFLNLGPLLANAGLLTLREQQIRRSPVRVLKQVAWYPLSPTTRTKILRYVSAVLPKSIVGRGLSRRPGDWPVDWSRTKAFPVGTGRVAVGIAINLKSRYPQGTVEDADYEAVRDQVIAALANVTDPDTGAPVFERVVRREDLYSGPAITDAPDILPNPQTGYVTVTGFRQPQAIARHDWGGHRMEGVYAVSRPLGLPDPETIDQVLPKVLEALDFRLAPEDESEVTTGATPEFSQSEAAQIEEHLRALGYTE